MMMASCDSQNTLVVYSKFSVLFTTPPDSDVTVTDNESLSEWHDQPLRPSPAVTLKSLPGVSVALRQARGHGGRGGGPSH